MNHWRIQRAVRCGQDVAVAKMVAWMTRPASALISAVAVAMTETVGAFSFSSGTATIVGAETNCASTMADVRYASGCDSGKGVGWIQK